MKGGMVQRQQRGTWPALAGLWPRQLEPSNPTFTVRHCFCYMYHVINQIENPPSQAARASSRRARGQTAAGRPPCARRPQT